MKTEIIYESTLIRLGSLPWSIGSDVGPLLMSGLFLLEDTELSSLRKLGRFRRRAWRSSGGLGRVALSPRPPKFQSG